MLCSILGARKTAVNRTASLALMELTYQRGNLCVSTLSTLRSGPPPGAHGLYVESSLGGGMIRSTGSTHRTGKVCRTLIDYH